jgi:phosphohistidine phosphatase
MKLLIIRHAIAVQRGTPEMPDEQRPLTARGEKRFKRAAKGLARVCARPDALLTSPLLRARRTAELAAAAWKRLEPVDVPALASGDDEGLEGVLATYPAEATLAIVGHEPHLSALLGRLLGGAASSKLTFRKGGAALLELPNRLSEGGQLLWYLPPRLLRRLA